MFFASCHDLWLSMRINYNSTYVRWTRRDIQLSRIKYIYEESRKNDSLQCYVAYIPVLWMKRFYRLDGLIKNSLPFYKNHDHLQMQTIDFHYRFPIFQHRTIYVLPTFSNKLFRLNCSQFIRFDVLVAIDRNILYVRNI